jgi:hypothetical protein
MHYLNRFKFFLKIMVLQAVSFQCNNRERVLFAAHQLVEPAIDWWDAYVEAHEELETINWQEF